MFQPTHAITTHCGDLIHTIESKSIPSTKNASKVQTACYQHYILYLVYKVHTPDVGHGIKPTLFQQNAQKIRQCFNASQVIPGNRR